MFQIVQEPIDAQAVQRAVEGDANGAVVVFEGKVRDHTDDRRVTHLEYEAYAPMAVKQMEAVAEAVAQRHGLGGIACVHRTGRLAIGDTAVVLAVSSPHRAAALSAIDDYIHHLKQDVPIWKKEHFEDGAVWVGTPEDPQGRGESTGLHPVAERPIYVVSDATGETAEQATRAALAQFGPTHGARTEIVSHVLDEEALLDLLQRASANHALIVYTLVEPQRRARMATLAKEHAVPAVDLLGGLIWECSRHLGLEPIQQPGLGYETDDAYYRRVEAVEFTVHNDDGRLPENLDQADIVFVGLSRTSKTPLSNYVAHRGYKVANVPIVYGLPLPREIEDVDPRRVFALVVDPGILVHVRRARLEALGVEPDGSYGDPKNVREEMLWARRLFRDHPGWTVIDITERAIEETASQVLDAYRRRFES